jgi:hypothetical protein
LSATGSAAGVAATGGAKWKAWAVPGAFWVLGPILGLALRGHGDLAPHEGSSFFEVCALIEPVIGLAVFVELVVVLGQLAISQGATSANRSLTRAVVRTNAGLMMLSEGCALYALAVETTSVFLLCAVVVPMILQLFLLIDCAYHRVGINRIRGG